MADKRKGQHNTATGSCRLPPGRYVSIALDYFFVCICILYLLEPSWTYLRPFVLGSTIGAFLFVPLVVFVNPTLGAIVVGLFILLVTWFPKWLNVSRLPYFLSGALTSGLGVLFGATGPLAMSAHPKANWSKEQIVGNHGAAMAFQHGIKVVAYLVAGVQLYAYLPHIVVLFVGAWVGTYIGTRVLKLFTDDRFKIMLKWVLTVLALRLILTNGYSMMF